MLKSFNIVSDLNDKEMTTIKTATGKEVNIAIASIYVREAFKKTICFLPEEVQISRMVAFNKSLFIKKPKQ